VKAVQAEATGVTGNMMRDEDTIPDPIILYSLSNLGDLARNLMAEHSGGFFDSIPLHHIAATDAAC
jgi:hypothetical protein